MIMKELDYRATDDVFFFLQREKEREVNRAEQKFYDRVIEQVSSLAVGTEIRTDKDELKLIEKVGLAINDYEDLLLIFYTEGQWYDLDGNLLRYEPELLRERRLNT